MPKISTSLLSCLGLNLTRLHFWWLLSSSILCLQTTVCYPVYQVNSNFGAYDMFFTSVLQHTWLILSFKSISVMKLLNFFSILSSKRMFVHAWVRTGRGCEQGCGCSILGSFPLSSTTTFSFASGMAASSWCPQIIQIWHCQHNLEIGISSLLLESKSKSLSDNLVTSDGSESKSSAHAPLLTWPWVVFEGLVLWTRKRPKPNQTEPEVWFTGDYL